MLTCGGDGLSSSGVWSNPIPVCAGTFYMYVYIAIDI